MRAALATTVLAAVIAVAAAGPSAAHGPTAAQIAGAVRRAERSRALWATVNICNSKAEPHRVGIRGQMPSLGYSSQMSMTIHLQAYSASAKRFVPIASPNAVDSDGLGTHTLGLQQWGAVFRFGASTTGRWNATIRFTWRRGGRVVGSTTRRTTSGHRDADHGSPPHYSAAQCTIR